jgi:hypothetical protein
MDMGFGTWNVRSLYRAGSLRTVAEEISKYELDLVGVQEVALNLQVLCCKHRGNEKCRQNCGEDATSETQR